MAIEITQTGRTATSITFSVSNDGTWINRYTSIYCYAADDFYGLETAAQLELIDSFSTTGGLNGTITINFNTEDTVENKIWPVYVENLDGDNNSIEGTDILYCILAFSWDNSATKVIGNNFDITVNDLKRLNLIAYTMFALIGSGTPKSFYQFLNDHTGDSVYAVYITDAAFNIRHAIYAANGYGWLVDNYNQDFHTTSRAQLSAIITNAVTGSNIKAEYFNNLCYIINHVNLIATS